MKFWDLVVTANRNLTRSKLRTLLTILAIFVGGFTLTLTTALNTGASEYLNRQLGNVSVPGVFEVFPKTDFNPLGSSDVKEYDPDKKSTSAAESFTVASMTQEDVQKLQKVEGVESAEPYYIISAEYIQQDGSKKYQLPQLSQHFGLNLDLAVGKLPTASDKNVIILPENYLQPLELTVNNAVGKKVVIAYKDARGTLQNKELTIVGVMRKTFVTAGQMFIDAGAMKEMTQTQNPVERYLTVFVTFKDVNDQTDEAVLKERIQNAGNYSAMSIKERISTVITIMTAITAALNVVGVIALIAASFGIINTLLMSVYERTREIGLMKAVGMHRRTVFGLFAIEAALVGFWGSVVAVGIAALASVGINSFATSTFLKDFEGFTLLVVSPMGAVFVIILIMTIAFLAGTLPAIKASRLDPIEALRSE